MGVLTREDRMGVAALTISPTTIATITTAEQTFTLTGLKINDVVFAVKPTAQAGLSVTHARVSAADTVAITFVNPTAAGILPTASEVYKIFWFRPETTVTGAVNP
jgi:hypothetical protein